MLVSNLCSRASPVNRTYLRQTRDAAEMLGKLIRLGRKERKMTEEDLSGRAGISRRTLQKIERGDLKCEIGLVFEVANIVGVKLFSDEENLNRYSYTSRIDDKLALLPKRVRRVVTVDDDFRIAIAYYVFGR
jgi:transcriptional regulator with XRE-family HTH domain